MDDLPDRLWLSIGSQSEASHSNKSMLDTRMRISALRATQARMIPRGSTILGGRLRGGLAVEQAIAYPFSGFVQKGSIFVWSSFGLFRGRRLQFTDTVP